MTKMRYYRKEQKSIRLLRFKANFAIYIILVICKNLRAQK
jgi:hypothetical protein